VSDGQDQAGQVDYDALAQKHGGTVDYDAIAKKYGAADSSGETDITNPEAMAAKAQEQAHQVPVEAMRQAHGAFPRPESSKAQDEAFDAALSNAPSFRPTLSPHIKNVPPGMENLAETSEKIPSVAGALSLFTPGVAANPIKTVGAIGGGMVGGFAGRKAGEAAGLSPEDAESAGDVGSLAGGGLGFAAGRPFDRGLRTPNLAGMLTHDITEKVAGPRIADAVFPDREKIYNQRAEALMNRGEEQDRLDAQAARAAKPVRNPPFMTTERPATQGFVPKIATDPVAEFTARQAAARQAAVNPVTGGLTAGLEGRVAGTRHLVLTPEELNTELRMQDLAKRRASERGMQFAAGMTPREGRSIPQTATRTPITEYPPVRSRVSFSDEDEE
jgi:hypothetical protein